VLEVARMNVLQNGLEGVVQVCQLDWRDPKGLSRGSFPLVLASDVLYKSGLAEVRFCVCRV
jgi:Lysine methyltransferase